MNKRVNNIGRSIIDNTTNTAATTHTTTNTTNNDYQQKHPTRSSNPTHHTHNPHRFPSPLSSPYERKRWIRSSIPDLRCRVHSLLCELKRSHRRSVFEDVASWYGTYSAVARSGRLVNVRSVVDDGTTTTDGSSGGGGGGGVGCQTTKKHSSSSNTNDRDNVSSSTTTSNNKDNHTNANTSTEGTKRMPFPYPTERTWADILYDLSQYLPYLTPSEHDLACRYTSVCLLSYLLPHASPFPTRDHQQHHQHQQHQHQENNNQQSSGYYLSPAARQTHCADPDGLPLPELLELSLRTATPTNDLTCVAARYDPDCIQYPTLVSSFVWFLERGLSSFLVSRPLSAGSYAVTTTMNTNGLERRYNPQQQQPKRHSPPSSPNKPNSNNSGIMDLLHILSMAISPELPTGVQPPSSLLPWNDPTRCLMECLPPLFFQISSGIRMLLVRIIANDLVLSPSSSSLVVTGNVGDSQLGGFDEEDDDIDDDIDEDGDNLEEQNEGEEEEEEETTAPTINNTSNGVLHLRTALQTCVLQSSTNSHLADARRALINIAIDTGDNRVVEEEMKDLVHCLSCSTRGRGCYDGAGGEGVVIGDSNDDSTNGSSRRRGERRKRIETTDCSPRWKERDVHLRRYVRRYEYYPFPPYPTTVVGGGTTTSGPDDSVVLRRRRYNDDGGDENDIYRGISLYCVEGDVLRDLILRYNGSRYYADGVFTRRVLGELEVALGMMVSQLEGQGRRYNRDDENENDTNRNEKKTEDEEKKDKQVEDEDVVMTDATNGPSKECNEGTSGGTDREKQSLKPEPPSACQVASLLDCTRALFYFLNLRTPNLSASPSTERAVVRGSGSSASPKNRNTATGGADAPSSSTSDVSQNTGPAEKEGRQSRRSEEDKTIDAIIEHTVRLLVCPDECVVVSASSLLALAFAYRSNYNNEDEDWVPPRLLSRIYQSIAFSVTKTETKKPNTHVQIFREVVAVASRRSVAFANSVVSLLLPLLRSATDVAKRESILRLVSVVTLARPRCVASRVEELMAAYAAAATTAMVVEGEVGGEERRRKDESRTARHLVAILLSCRGGYAFDTSSSATTTEIGGRYGCHINAPLALVRDPWERYRIGRHAFTTGNFGIARSLFDELRSEVSSSSSFLWMAALEKVAAAEETVAADQTFGLPSALVALDSAINTVRSLATFLPQSAEQPGLLPSSHESSSVTAFQIEYLCRRKDFLNLCLITRGVCAEMRLTDTTATRTTRQYIHRRNISLCFRAVASRYAEIGRKFGLWRCQQTRTALRGAFALAKFMEEATMKAFGQQQQQQGGRKKGSPSSAVRNTGRIGKDRSPLSSSTSEHYHNHHVRSNNEPPPQPSGDDLHPLFEVLAKIKRKIIEPMNENVDPAVRAEAVIQTIDAVCRCPFPTPRGFFILLPLPTARVRIYEPVVERVGISDETDDEHLNYQYEEDEETDDESASAEVIDVPAGTSCTLSIDGLLPNECFVNSGLVFSQAVVWHTVTYDGPLPGDEDQDDLPSSSLGSSAGGDGGDGGDNGTGGGVSENADMEEHGLAAVQGVATPLLPGSLGLDENGREISGVKFLATIECVPPRKEGYYKVEVTVGLRDVRFGEYGIPLEGDCGIVFLCVSSS